MFIITNAAKSVRRHPHKSLIYFTVCVVATLVLQVYLASIDRTQRQLDDLPDAMPVYARVASLNGQRFDMLQIDEITVDALLESPFVRDLKLTVMFSTYFADKLLDISGMSFRERVENSTTYFATGINSTEALEGFDADNVTWFPGYGPDIFTGNENVCIVDSSILASSGYFLGDNIEYVMPTKFVFSKEGWVQGEFVDPLPELRIVGVTDLIGLQSSVSDRGATQLTLSTLVVPFKTARVVLESSKTEFTASSATFYVNDTHRLNEFKEEMKALKLEERNTTDTARIRANQGVSLRVEDASFISAAIRLRESLSLLRGFLPLVAVALAVVGYLVAYLAVQSRREEYAVYRLLGLGKAGGFLLFFAELAAITLAGSLLGAAASVLFGLGGLSVGLLVFLIFSACFLVGGVIALLRLGRTNVMFALTHAE